MRSATLLVVALVAGMALLFAACGDAEDGVPQDEPAIEDGAVLHLALSEWSITAEDGSAIPSSQAGEVTFEVHNHGATPHELAVLRTGQPAGELPVSGATVDEDAAGELLGRTENINADDTEVLTLELDPGTYALICNIAGHYDQGMYAELTVE